MDLKSQFVRLQQTLGVKAYKEVVAGLIVALTLIPESVAFSIVAGVRPFTSIVTTCVMLFIPAIVNGKPGMMSGAAGAVAVVTRQLVMDQGEQLLFLSVILCGFIQMAISRIPSIDSLLRMVPHSVVSGFSSGLALLILKSQLHHFSNFNDPFIGSMIGYTVLGLICLQVVNRMNIKFLPPPVISLMVTTAVSIVLALPTATVADVSGNVQAGTESFLQFPQISWSLEELLIVLPFSFTICCIGITETVLTMQVLDRRTELQGSISNEVFGQGLANFVGGLIFGSQGGCAMLVPTTLNFNSGGRTRWSVVSCGVSVLGFLFAGSFILAKVPVAGLCAILIDVCLHIFDWGQYSRLHKLPRIDAITTVMVTCLTIWTNLAVGALSGIVLNALWWSARSGQLVSVKRIVTHRKTGMDIRYQVNGPLFWASVPAFEGAFDPKRDLEAANVKVEVPEVLDQSGQKCLETLQGNYARRGISLVY